MQVKLTIGERLKDLRVAKKLTLEQLSTEVGISKSALGKYESDNGKDISPYSISMLADYYGVSSDYLMGRTETKNHPNTALHELHLSDASIDVYTFTSFSGQSDFAAQKSCDCAVAHITKSACPALHKFRWRNQRFRASLILPPKSVCQPLSVRTADGEANPSSAPAGSKGITH